jgi:hypothetical protein
MATTCEISETFGAPVAVRPGPEQASGDAPLPPRGRGGDHYTLAAAAVSLLFFALVYRNQSLHATHPRHGDCWTEMLCSTSARNFATHGFHACCFNPTMDRGQDIGLPPLYVSDGRHPPGTTVVLGLLHSAGLSLAEARAVPLTLSALALLAFFALTRRVLGEGLTPLLAAIAVAVAPAFWLLSDSLYYFGYDFLLKPLFWLFVYLATFAEARRDRYLAGAVLVGFVAAAFSSYETLPSMGLFCLLFPLLFGKGELRDRAACSFRFGVFVSLGFVLALASRLAHLAVAHGGLEVALHNFQTAVRVRSVGLPGVEGMPPPWPVYLADVVARVWYYYPVHVLFSVVALGLVGLLRAPRPAVKLVVLLGAAEGAYFLLMRQHCDQHRHTLYHLVFTAGLLTALAIRALAGLCAPGQPRAAVTGALTALLVLAAVTLGPTRSETNLERAHDWSAWIRSSRAAAAHIPVDGVVVMNTWTDPKHGFFLDRTYIQREGYDFENMRIRGPWGLRQLRALNTSGRPLYVVSRAHDPNYQSFCRELRRVATYGVVGGEQLEVFEVRR